MAEAEEEQQFTAQELSKRCQSPPAIYIQREEDRPAPAVEPPSPIPVVDLRRLFQPNGGDDEAAKLRSALQSWGLFQAIGHGMSDSFLDEVHNAAREFFQLPMELKQKYKIPKFTKEFPQGYGNDYVSTEDQQILTWTDRLSLKVLPEDERKLELWPEDPSSFRNVLQEFTIKAKKTADYVLKSIARLLNLNEDYFVSQLGERAEVITRFSYYPCCSRPDLVLGINPHSDNSMVTILLSDKDVEGLEVLKDGNWLKVSTVPHAVLINLGDMMEIMCNGIFKSPVHRVVTNMEKERISVAMFFHLDTDKELGPADGLVNEARPRLYRTMKTKDYMEVFYKYFIKGERAIDLAKI